MINASIGKEYNRPRILMFSQRNISPYDVWRSPHFEFEDIVGQIDSVELLAPRPGKRFNLGNKIAQRVARHSTIALNPGIPKIKLTNRYDMFFAFCSFPKDLLNFCVQNDWKEYCRTSVCMIDEIWVKQISQQKCYLKILSKFDYVVLYYSQSVKAVSDATGKRCFFLPPGVDAIKFCPHPDLPKKVIDVYSIGRRSEVTHRKLLETARERNLFYVYDTISGNQTVNTEEHRNLLANMAKRSRFYVVNPGLIDCPEIRGNQIEIGNRYFEGAAAGCMMIGEIPKNEVFESLFNWPDAVIYLPFGSDQVGAIIDDLDRQPNREDKIRRNNIVHSLRQHDWVYRWEFLLKIGGLDPMPGLLERKRRLEKLATIVEEETTNI
jgi:hypothetical protein